MEALALRSLGATKIAVAWKAVKFLFSPIKRVGTDLKSDRG